MLALALRGERESARLFSMSLYVYIDLFSGHFSMYGSLLTYRSLTIALKGQRESVLFFHGAFVLYIGLFSMSLFMYIGLFLRSLFMYAGVSGGANESASLFG